MKCATCQLRKGPNAFSTNQLKKKSEKRCKLCVKSKIYLNQSQHHLQQQHLKCSACTKYLLESDFSRTQMVTKAVNTRRCVSCIELGLLPNQGELKCSVCLHLLPEGNFSKTELEKDQLRRQCRKCVVKMKCSCCSRYLQESNFSKSQLKDRSYRECRDCRFRSLDSDSSSGWDTCDEARALFHDIDTQWGLMSQHNLTPLASSVKTRVRKLSLEIQISVNTELGYKSA